MFLFTVLCGEKCTLFVVCLAMPRFYFATCQVGAEKALKAEIARELPDLKFAFSRPGFITFKQENGPVVTPKNSVFTRLWGESIDQVKGDDPEPLFAKIPEGALTHAFSRDQYVPGDEPEDYVEPGFEIEEGSGWNRAPKIGETVYDLIFIDEGHFFLGKHTHTKFLDPAPGNKPNIPLPKDAPSRAYLKIEEAIQRFNPKAEPDMEVLEVGCSPGGATFTLLKRGYKCVGIDPKLMADPIQNNKNFKLIRKLAKNVQAPDFAGANPTWIIMDMSLAPLEALDEIKHVITVLREMHGRQTKLKCAFLTIKLNDWKFAESIPLYLRRIEELGLKRMRAMQLSTNRQEFFVYGEF